MPTLTVKKDGSGDYTTIQAAVTAAGAGDIVEIQDSGTYTEAVVPNGALDPITLRAGAGFSPVLDGGSALGNGIAATNGWVIEGLEISNYTTDGINGNGANARYTVRDCYVHDVGNMGIRQVSGTAGGGGGATIERVRIFGAVNHSLKVDGDEVTVRNVLVVRPGSTVQGINAGGWNGAIDNCTVVGVNGAGSRGISSAATNGVRNCIVTAGAAAAHGIDSFPVGDYNCVFGAYSVAAFTNGIQANDITTDPAFADAGADDYRLTITSPCVDTAVTLALVTDDLLAVARPHAAGYDRGAYELLYLLSLLSATAPSSTTVLATFNFDPAAASVEDAVDWTVVPVGLAGAVTVTAAVVQADPATVLLTVTPALTAGGTYTVTAVNAANAVGTLAVPNFVLMIVPAGGVLPALAEFPARFLRSLLHAFGRLFQEVDGVPSTRLIVALASADTTAFVESTLAFPAAGSGWIGRQYVTWTGKGQQTLTGLTFRAPRLHTFPAGSTVTLDPTSVGVT